MPVSTDNDNRIEKNFCTINRGRPALLPRKTNGSSPLSTLAEVTCWQLVPVPGTSTRDTPQQTPVVLHLDKTRSSTDLHLLPTKSHLRCSAIVVPHSLRFLFSYRRVGCCRCICPLEGRRFRSVLLGCRLHSTSLQKNVKPTRQCRRGGIRYHRETTTTAAANTMTTRDPRKAYFPKRKSPQSPNRLNDSMERVSYNPIPTTNTNTTTHLNQSYDHDRSGLQARDLPASSRMQPASSTRAVRQPYSSAKPNHFPEQYTPIVFSDPFEVGSVGTGMSQQELLRTKARETRRRSAGGGIFSSKKKNNNKRKPRTIISIPSSLLARSEIEGSHIRLSEPNKMLGFVDDSQELSTAETTPSEISNQHNLLSKPPSTIIGPLPKIRFPFYPGWPLVAIFRLDHHNHPLLFRSDRGIHNHPTSPEGKRCDNSTNTKCGISTESSFCRGDCLVAGSIARAANTIHTPGATFQACRVTEVVIVISLLTRRWIPIHSSQERFCR